jgi:hypothetical protein
MSDESNRQDLDDMTVLQNVKTQDMNAELHTGTSVDGVEENINGTINMGSRENINNITSNIDINIDTNITPTIFIQKIENLINELQDGPKDNIKEVINDLEEELNIITDNMTDDKAEEFITFLHKEVGVDFPTIGLVHEEEDYYPAIEEPEETATIDNPTITEDNISNEPIPGTIVGNREESEGTDRATSEDVVLEGRTSIEGQDNGEVTPIEEEVIDPVEVIIDEDITILPAPIVIEPGPARVIEELDPETEPPVIEEPEDDKSNNGNAWGTKKDNWKDSGDVKTSGSKKDGDHDKGHGNNEEGVDLDNPGKSKLDERDDLFEFNDQSGITDNSWVNNNDGQQNSSNNWLDNDTSSSNDNDDFDINNTNGEIDQNPVEDNILIDSFDNIPDNF